MTTKGDRYGRFCKMIEELDRGVELIEEYDSLLHDYNGVMLFQAESQLIKAIGDKPGITGKEVADIFHKSPSACSQLVRKLKAKGWVSQTRNEKNSRIYNLYLTKEGIDIYEKHHDFEETCYLRMYNILSDVSEEDFEVYIKIQQKLNEAFAEDVKESMEL